MRFREATRGGAERSEAKSVTRESETGNRESNHEQRPKA
jgi:hypothetical protein